ncbi:MAG: hypothetical protein HPY65_07740 [Syntrophaceae bacterium]|nr:hypothetical protein [Syntrophaceae bacterium]
MKIKVVIVNIVLIVAVVLVAEWFAWLWPYWGEVEQTAARYEGTCDQNYFRSNVPFLGYAPGPGSSCTVRMLYGERVIYDAQRTIGSDGLRITPASKSPNAPGIAFFGCSITFGDGVNDNESMPYRFAELTGYKVWNFGFSGYGPHQMLSALEHGIADRVVGNVAPKVVVYQAIPHHVTRVEGDLVWYPDGPRYVSDGNGGVNFAGNLHGSISSWIMDQSMKTNIGRRYWIWKAQGGGGDIDLTVKIVARSRDLVKQKWPDARFVVLYWPVDSETSTRLEEGFRRAGMTVHRVTEAIPDWRLLHVKYSIPHDGHPNALAHNMIAEYLAKNL